MLGIRFNRQMLPEAMSIVAEYMRRALVIGGVVRPTRSVSRPGTGRIGEIDEVVRLCARDRQSGPTGASIGTSLSISWLLRTQYVNLAVTERR